MGLRENHRNFVRLEAAAVVVERGWWPELSAPELMLISFMFLRFKKPEACYSCQSAFEARSTTDLNFRAEAEIFGRLMEGVSESDWKTLKRPEVQTAFTKLGV